MRAILLVIDSFGIGALPDAGLYGDEGSNTAVHIGQAVGGVSWPHLQAWGLGNASELLGNPIPGCPSVSQPMASYGVMEETSPGKDTTTGHWELAGIQLKKAFPIFPAQEPSFPVELTKELSRMTGYQFLGNRAASGTEIIQELGEEHLKSGKPIIYTSGDSVFQIAAHESVMSLERLYNLCSVARQLCDPYLVARVIARPFTGEPGRFERTAGRHDYSIALPEKSLLDHLLSQGVHTVGVGKIGDIFNLQGLGETYPDKGNVACLERTLGLMQNKKNHREFLFVNLVDTDMVWGHRRDPQGYHDCVAITDAWLPQFVDKMDDQDLLMVTADHGCDPTFRGSDHTREYVPLLVYSKKHPGVSLGIRSSFSDVSRTLADFFQLPLAIRKDIPGQSFYSS